MPSTSPLALILLLVACRNDPADGWTTEAVPLPAPAAFGVPSALAVTADGAVHLLVESYGDLFAVHRKAGAWTYELLEPLPGPCCTSGTARLAVDPDGSLWAAVLRVFPTPGLFLYHQGAGGWSSEDTAALRVTDPTYELALDVGPDGGLWLLRAEWSNGSRLDSLPRVAHWTAEGWTDAPVPGGPRQFTHVGAGLRAFDGEVAIALQDADGIQWITTDGAQIQAQQLPGPGGTPRLAVSGTPSSPGVAYLTERQPDGSTIAVGRVDRAGTVEIPVDLAAINGGYPRPFLVDDAGVLHAITEYASSGTEPHRYLAVQFPDGVDQDCDGRPDGRSGLTPTQPTADLDAAQIDQLCGWAATLADDAPAPDSCWPAVDEATCPARVVMCPTVETFEQCQLAVAAGQCDAPDGLGACAPCVSPVDEHRATDDLSPEEADAVCDWAAALDPDTDRCPLAVDGDSCDARLPMCPTVETFDACQLAMAQQGCDAGAMPAACASCTPDLDLPPESGVETYLRLLTDTQWEALCDWSIALQGGEGRVWACHDGAVTTGTTAECLALPDALSRNCFASVGDYEACQQEIAADPCNGFDAPACDALAACLW